MNTTEFLHYDGSFQGFLSTLYQALKNPSEPVQIRKEDPNQQHLFAQAGLEASNPLHARELWQAMQARSIGLSRLVYFAFLSEQKGVESLLLEYLRSVFKGTHPAEEVRQKWKQTLSKWARAVELEKTSLENTLVFTSAKNRIPRAEISPRYNVLPLLSRHFRQRSPGMEWIIYDRTRKCGLHANAGEVEFFQTHRNNTENVKRLGFGKAPEKNYRTAV